MILLIEDEGDVLRGLVLVQPSHRLTDGCLLHTIQLRMRLGFGYADAGLRNTGQREYQIRHSGILDPAVHGVEDVHSDIVGFELRCGSELRDFLVDNVARSVDVFNART